MLLGGDLNADQRSAGMRSLSARGWFEDSHLLHPGVDHVFVRSMGMEQPPTPWPSERRDLHLDGDLPVRLSDHDPVDAVVTF